MALEEGVITRKKENTAFIVTKRAAACEGCSERHVCRSFSAAEDPEIEVANPIDAGPGDTVIVAFKTSRLIFLSFLLYIFPVAAMLAGAVAGDQIAGQVNGDRSIYAASAGFLAMGTSLGFIILKDRKARRSGRYMPVIVDIKKKGKPEEIEGRGACSA